jgi:hypothetical protein
LSFSCSFSRCRTQLKPLTPVLLGYNQDATGLESIRWGQRTIRGFLSRGTFLMSARILKPLSHFGSPLRILAALQPERAAPGSLFGESTESTGATWCCGAYGRLYTIDLERQFPVRVGLSQKSAGPSP